MDVIEDKVMEVKMERLSLVAKVMDTTRLEEGSEWREGEW